MFCLQMFVSLFEKQFREITMLPAEPSTTNVISRQVSYAGKHFDSDDNATSEVGHL